MAILWQRMTESFTSIWLSQYVTIGGDTFLIWSRHLTEFSPRLIVDVAEQLIEHAIETENEYPPNLIRFIRHCRNERQARHNRKKILPAPRPEYATHAERLASPTWQAARRKCLEQAKKIGYRNAKKD